MAIPVIMPKQGQSVETCIITKWFRQKGEQVKTGDILFSYETDKAAFDFESAADGTILDILYPEGAEVPVLANVAVIGSPGEIIEATKTSDSVVAGKEERAILLPGPEIGNHDEKRQIPVPESGAGRIRISPRARRVAEKKGIDYSKIRGSGPNGRILCSDIMNAGQEAYTGSPLVSNGVDEFTDKPLTNVRKLIARSMHASLMNSAQLTHHMSADVRGLLEARRRIKENLSAGRAEQADITLNDMICYCVIKALSRFPEANSHFLDDHMRIFKSVHLGIAVDTPRGLMVPAVRNADSMDIVSLSRSLKSVADDCKKGSIDPELIKSTAASFTVSNLGNYGVEMFTPVINLPQTAILGVCTIINRPADLGNNTFGFVPYIGLSLTYDHRAIDGGPATLFLREIKKEIESFTL
ncbi:MAG: 2-oxo acid dehydrogenase subunit E2 [Bacteroidales bacterium]|nr:2-oxo acid dehydrogenase subunit E2 [Bacteroidales bacterium]